MDTVEYQGKVYTKANVVAKRFNYTADYIGQLCRSGKIDSRLVGRAWYVHIPSIDTHRSQKYKNTEPAVQKPIVTTQEVREKNYTKRVVVEPILNKKVVNILKQNKKTGIYEPVPVRYESDDYSLIPSIQKNSVNKRLPVNPAQAKQVRIKKRTMPGTRFSPTPIPEVSLKGKLSVIGIPEPTEEDTPQEAVVQEQVEKEVSPEMQKNVEKTSHIGSNRNRKEVEVSESTGREELVKANVLAVKNVPAVKSRSRVEHVRPLIVTKQQKLKPVIKKTSAAPSLLLSAIILIVTLAIAAFLFGVEAEVQVTKSEYSSSTIFDFTNLKSLFTR